MVENQGIQPLDIEVEELPAIQYRIYATGTEGLDMGLYGANSWIKETGGEAAEKTYARYDFTASSGYSSRKDNYSNEGQAIRFLYDFASSPYAKKRQFRVSSHIYVLGKTFTKTNVDAAYTTALTQAERKALKTRVDYNNLAARDVPYDNIVLNQYNKIGTPGSGIYVLPGLTGSITANAYYAAYTELQMAGVTSANPPYLEMAAEDVVPYPVNPSPSEQFVDRTEDIPISWEMGYDQSRSLWQEAPNGSLYTLTGVVDGQLYQKAALLRWKQEGDPTVHEARMGSENRYLLPAGSVTADSFQWQVILTTDDDVSGEDTDVWYTATTNNDAVSTANIVSPQAVVLDGDKANLFQWTHEISTDTRPTGADLQYSLDNGDTWVDFLHVSTRETHMEVPSRSFPNGVLLWRVRTYNASGVAGSWSESAQFTVINGVDIANNIGITRLDTLASSATSKTHLRAMMQYRDGIIYISNGEHSTTNITTWNIDSGSINESAGLSIIPYTPSSWCYFDNGILSFNGIAPMLYSPADNANNPIAMPSTPVAPPFASLNTYDNQIIFLTSDGLYTLPYSRSQTDASIPVCGIVKGQKFVGQKELPILNKPTITTQWQTATEDFEICLGEYDSFGEYRILIKN